ncbi:hypothetical protein MMC28_006495 [Mycoblastus sanguinarius]|nr:hypothetical protein [Mycoblastus sanguinarius]
MRPSTLLSTTLLLASTTLQADVSNIINSVPTATALPSSVASSSSAPSTTTTTSAATQPLSPATQMGTTVAVASSVSSSGFPLASGATNGTAPKSNTTSLAPSVSKPTNGGMGRLGAGGMMMMVVGAVVAVVGVGDLL